MSDPRTILNLDPTRFLSDGDAVMEHRPRYHVIPYTDPRIADAPPPSFDPVAGWEDADTMDRLMDEALGDYDADADLHASWEIAR